MNILISKVGVIGAGTMGFGIAFQFAINGVHTKLVDISDQMLEEAKGKFKTYLNLFRAEGYDIRLTDEEVMSYVTFTTNFRDLANVDLVIESVTENLTLKQNIFKELDEICDAKTILTSNTSSLKYSEITRHVTKHKDRTLLTHFFNPAHIVPLVELLRSSDTSEEVFNEVKTFLEKNNKVTIEVKKEVAGLVANRLQAAMVREALSLIEDGVVSEKDLDTAIFEGPGFRFSSSGLLKIMDFGGLDVWKAVMDGLQPEIESGVRSFKKIDQKVEEGTIGVKSGKGFYDYPGKSFDGFVMDRDTELVNHLLTTHPKLKAKEGIPK